MSKKKTITEPAKTNKDLTLDFSKYKESVGKTKDSYYDFNKKIVEDIAKINDLSILSNDNMRTLVQALFPDYLVSSGLLHAVVLFHIENGVVTTPPKYWYSDVRSYLNNDKELAANKLIDEIKDLFVENDIIYSEMWETAFKKKSRKDQ